MKLVEIVEKDVCVCEERKAKLERNFPEFSLNLHEHMVFRYILYHAHLQGGYCPQCFI